MARKINLNSSEIYQKLGTPSISPRATMNYFSTSQDRRHSASVDTSSPHIQSPDFSRQLPRNELKQFSADVHEKRFVSFQNFPIISTRVPRVSAPNIARTTGRDFKNIYQKQQDCSEYHPNYQAIWKGSGRKLLSFDMTMPRKPFFKQKSVNVNSKDVRYSQIDANVAVPDLEKASSRHIGEAVPCFMMNLHYLDRVTGHVVPNFKSLQMNNYMNTSFLPLSSTFGARLDSPKKANSTMKGRRKEA